MFTHVIVRLLNFMHGGRINTEGRDRRKVVFLHLT